MIRKFKVKIKFTWDEYMKKAPWTCFRFNRWQAGCSKPEAPATDAAKSDTAKEQTVVMASTGSDADIWRYIAALPETKEGGYQS